MRRSTDLYNPSLPKLRIKGKATAFHSRHRGSNARQRVLSRGVKTVGD